MPRKNKPLKYLIGAGNGDTETGGMWKGIRALIAGWNKREKLFGRRSSLESELNPRCKASL